MATPTISSVTPSRGHSGGGTVLRIVGTNFQLPPTPPASGSGPVPEADPTVRVFVGGVEARRVRVASATVLYVTTERRDPAAGLTVEVRNVGPWGETIALGTKVTAYEYARPVLTTPSDLERLVKTLHAELVRQVYPEVVVTAHVDWADPAAALRGVATAPLPCVFLAGPTLRPNQLYRTAERARPALSGVADVVLEHRAPLTDDVVFIVGALADKHATIISLSAALRDFKLRNPFLWFPRSDGSTNLVRYDLTFEGDFSVDSSPDESNVRTCSTTVSIDGFDTLTAPGFDNDQAVTAHPELLEDPELEAERHGG